MGDFNIDMLDKSCDLCKEFNSLISSHGLKPHIFESTRKGTKESCLDNIYSNSDIIKYSGKLDWNFSDHQAVFVNRKKTFEKMSKIKFIGRSYKNYDKEIFQENLKDFNWNEFFVEEDPDVCWSICISKIIKTLDEMCPEKEFIIDKDKALRVAKKSNIEDDWKYAKYMRNNVGKLIEEAKKNYLNDEFLTTKKIQKNSGETLTQFFQIIRKMTNQKNS